MTRRIPAPGNVSETSDGDSTLIFLRWNRGKTVNLFWPLFWMIVIFLVVHAVFDRTSPHLWGERILGIWTSQISQLLVPTLATTIVGYMMLTQSYNRTEILITESELKISVRPIPAWGNQTIQISEISQLFVKERYSDSSEDNGPSRRTYYYELRWFDSRNKSRLLIGRLLAPEALYLEKRMEKILGITNQSVKGAFLA